MGIKNKVKIIIFVASIIISIPGLLFSQPDLEVDLTYLVNNIQISNESFSSSSCDVQEDCTSPGSRKLLRFGQRIKNIGNSDFDIGTPNSEPYFEYDPCHKHYHFIGFAKYELFDLQCNIVRSGIKKGGCMMNFDPGNSCHRNSPFDDCGSNDRQGISAGCADVYFYFLSCQYIDITNLTDGMYFLKVHINFDENLRNQHSMSFS